MKPKIEQEQELNFVNNFWKSDAKKETMQPKSIDRNLVIRCANEQEQELVKQWLRNNGEPICEYFNANKFGNYIFFNTGKQWDNTTFSPEHTTNGERTVTPQELNIIPAPTEEFKNGDVVDAFFSNGWFGDYLYVGKNPASNALIVLNKDGAINSVEKVRNPIKKVTMQQVADKFGYELGTFKIEG